MRIDNDFLTLLDLTVKLAMAKANAPTVAYESVMASVRLNIENLTLKRDALVAKINAADDADAAIEKQTAALTEASKKTNDALAKVLKTMEAMVEAKDAAPAPNADGEGR
ncbi:MAG: hypothetical protein AABZ76_07295 [Pseudomonadota bacterium]